MPEFFPRLLQGLKAFFVSPCVSAQKALGFMENSNMHETMKTLPNHSPDSPSSSGTTPPPTPQKGASAHFYRREGGVSTREPPPSSV